MRSLRMPISGLMVIVLACGLAFTALRDPSPQGASLSFTTAMTTLLFALLGLFVGRYKTFWLGFVIFGWGYAYLAFGPHQWHETRPFLYTSRILSDAYDALLKSRTRTVRAEQLEHLPPTASAELRYDDSTVGGDQFQRIGHSLAAILHGVAGGLLAVFLAHRKREGGSARADHPMAKAIAEDGPQ